MERTPLKCGSFSHNIIKLHLPVNISLVFLSEIVLEAQNCFGKFDSLKSHLKKEHYYILRKIITKRASNFMQVILGTRFFLNENHFCT